MLIRLTASSSSTASSTAAVFAIIGLSTGIWATVGFTNTTMATENHNLDSAKQEGEDKQDKSKPEAENDKNRLPWKATGQVNDAQGKPIESVLVRAHCGFGSLRQTGSTKTDADGKYELKFGPGIWSQDRKLVQAATISVQLDGHFEQNLHRQGDLVAAYENPEGEIGWGGKTEEQLFLPGKTIEINFVMLPATHLRGLVVNKDGKRPEGLKISLKGKDMPPSSSVAAFATTNENGVFEMKDIPTGFSYQILVRPKERGSPWLAWASAPITFLNGDSGDTHIKYEIDGKQTDFSCQRFHLMLQGDGVNWKTALKEAAKKKLKIQWDGLSTEKLVRAGSAWTTLGEKSK